MPINHTKKSLSMKQKATKSVWGEPLIKLHIITKTDRREPSKMQDETIAQQIETIALLGPYNGPGKLHQRHSNSTMYSNYNMWEQQ